MDDIHYGIWPKPANMVFKDLCDGLQTYALLDQLTSNHTYTQWYDDMKVGEDFKERERSAHSWV